MTLASLVNDERFHDCDTEEIPALLAKLDARELTVGSLDMLVRVAQGCIAMEKVRSLALLLAYADTCNGMGRSKRMPIADMDGLVEKWTDVIVGLSTAHEPERHTRADEQTDDLLGPLLVAPIGQVRDFARRLAERLESDKRVPFMVWSSFKRVVLPLILKGPDGSTIELKTTLAREIAELVEQDLPRADLITAIAGALQWRASAALERVKAGLEAGAKPVIRGRESCLFLEVGDAMVVL
jgi:hypothetical protein